MIKTERKECFGESSLYLKFFAAINAPIGDSIAISKVMISFFGTYKIVSPFLMSLAAWTPL
jgi:hypothetical protein